MGIYKIYAGLSGGFGGAQYIETEEFDTMQCAESYAYECAKDDYESRLGSQGLRGIYEIMGADDVDEETAWETYNEEQEDWLDYYVKEVSSFEDNDDE